MTEIYYVTPVLIYTGYSIITLALVIAILFVREYRKPFHALLDSSNLLLLAGVYIMLFNTISNLLIIQRESKANMLLHTYSSDVISILFGPTWYVWWLNIFFQIMLPQLLWIKRFRVNTPIAFLMIICSTYPIWGSYLTQFLINLKHEFLSSYWVIGLPALPDIIIKIAIYVLLLTGLHLLKKRIK